MPFTIPAGSNRTAREILGETAQLVALLGLIFGLALALVVLATATEAKIAITAVAFIVLVLGAVVSGNPRLYCLWWLILTIPLTLSKRFGPMFLNKAGGENSYRFEISDLFLFALAGFILWDIYSGRRTGFRIPKVTFLWLALAAMGFAWVVVGPFRTAALQEAIRMVKVIVLFVIVVNELDRPDRIWHSAIAVALGAIAESAIALVEYFKQGLIGLDMFGETNEATIAGLKATSVEGEGVFRPSALLQHPNILGIYLAFLIPLLIGMLMVSRKTISKGYFLLSLTLAGPAMIAALSRSSWVCAAVGTVFLLFFMLLHPDLRRRSLAGALRAGIVGIIILGIFIGPITQRLLRSKEDSTIAREIFRNDAMKMIGASPWFGLGLNSYTNNLAKYGTLAIEHYGTMPAPVHNTLYLWWAETGLVGLLIYLGVLGSIIWTGIRNLAVRDEFLFTVNAACLAGVISLIPDSFFGFTLRLNTTLRVFWLIAGMILAIRYLRLQEKADLAIPLEPSMQTTDPVAT